MGALVDQGSDGRAADDQPPDVLEGGPTQVSPLRRRWAAASPGQRRAATTATAALAVAVVLPLVVAAAGQWNLEQRRRDQVDLAATLDVSSTSTVGSGRVDYFAVVRNLSPRQVLVDRIELTTTSLHLTSRNVASLVVPPDGAIDVPVSVRLDCAAPAAATASTPPLVVVTTPESGRQQIVRLTLGHVFLVTDVAVTLCRVRPGLTDTELSGPVT